MCPAVFFTERSVRDAGRRASCVSTGAASFLLCANKADERWWRSVPAVAPIKATIVDGDRRAFLANNVYWGGRVEADLLKALAEAGAHRTRAYPLSGAQDEQKSGEWPGRPAWSHVATMQDS